MIEWNSIVSRRQKFVPGLVGRNAGRCHPGLVIRRNEADGKSRTEMGSMMLLPTKFPSSAYNQALAVQRVYNELYLKVAHDYQFMKESLAR